MKVNKQKNETKNKKTKQGKQNKNILICFCSDSQKNTEKWPL